MSQVAIKNHPNRPVIVRDNGRVIRLRIGPQGDSRSCSIKLTQAEARRIGYLLLSHAEQEPETDGK